MSAILASTYKARLPLDKEVDIKYTRSTQNSIFTSTFPSYQSIDPAASWHIFAMSDYNTAEFTRYADVHKQTNGAGDARPTALQIVKDNNLEGKPLVLTFIATSI
jgi:hypothetical protein